MRCLGLFLLPPATLILSVPLDIHPLLALLLLLLMPLWGMMVVVMVVTWKAGDVAKWWWLWSSISILDPK
jgi:hypothetical protein